MRCQEIHPPRAFDPIAARQRSLLEEGDDLIA
jgi:hypothetical protein